MKNKSIEILTLFPYVKSPSNLQFHYHLGAGYIHAFLGKKGISSKFYIQGTARSLEELAVDILNQHPRIIGFTCYDANYYIIKLISRALKKNDGNIFILIGGPTATFSDRLIMRDAPSIDVCVRGEGEYTTLELIRCLKDKTPLHQVKGITFREKGRIVRTEDRPLIKSIEDMPSPYLSGTIPPSEGTKLGILTSRGCSQNCIFCLFAAISRKSVRFYSIHRITAELSLIAQHTKKKKLVKIYDDSFSTDPNRVRELCRIINDKGLSQHFDFWCETRADSVDRELLEILYQSGFKQISFGLESASPEILRRIKKVSKVPPGKNDLGPEKQFIQKVKENTTIAKEIGFQVDLSIILGLPGETLEQGKKTLDFVKQAAPDAYSHNILSVHPGTELFRSHMKYHLKVKTMLPYGGFYQTLHNYDTSGIKALDNAIITSSIRFIARIAGGHPGHLTSTPPTSVILDHNDRGMTGRTLPSLVFSWLRGVVHFGTNLFLQSSVLNNDIYLEYRRKMVLNHIPFYTLFFLRQRRQDDDYRFSFNNYPVSYDLLSTPFSNPSRKIDDKIRELVLLTLDTPGDLEKFISLSSEASRNGKLMLWRSVLNSVYTIEDGCRWNCIDCPASSLSKIIIENDLNIRPCKHGKPIGKVGENFNRLKKKINKRWQSEIEKRGCHRCPVKDSCSKCLFPHPVDTAQYCRIRKSNPYLPEIIQLLEITRQVPFPKQKSKESIHMWVFQVPGKKKKHHLKTSLKALAIGENYYIHDSSIHKTRPVSKTVMEILLGLMQGKSKHEISRDMAARYHLKIETMTKSMEKVMAMCAQHGYLTGSKSR